MKANIAHTSSELMLTREQKRIFAQALPAVGVSWNKATELQGEAVPEMSFSSTRSWPDGWCCGKRKTDMLWLQEVFRHQQCLMDAFKVIQAFKAKKRASCSKLGAMGIFRIPQVRPTDWDEANGRVRIPKTGFVRFRKSRPIQGKIKQMTVSVECGHCLGRDGDGFRQRRSASSRRGRH